MGMYENGNGIDEEILRLQETLENLDPTEDDYEKVIESLQKLYKLRNDQFKTELDNDARANDRESVDERHEKDLAMKQQEVDLDERQRVDAAERVRLESEQKAAELEVKRLELELEERKRVDAAAARAEEALQKTAELEVKKQELALAEKTHEDQMASCKKDRVQNGVITAVNMVTGILKLGAAIAFGIVMTDQGYKFEKDGCPTSVTFREGRKTFTDLVKETFKK
ncbi:MAG: hypothetical protein J6U54_03490 [Clostridiales bacterium]|nr:hypothetical protein [Clostridiales bacterium]